MAEVMDGKDIKTPPGESHRDPLNSLLKDPILAYPDFNERFSLYTDASNTDSQPDLIPGDLGTDITVDEEPENDNHPNEEESETDPAELEVRSIQDKKIVKNRSGRKQTYYLVEWADDNIELSWEPLSNLHCGVTFYR
eukprot:gene13524-biopygen10791